MGIIGGLVRNLQKRRRRVIERDAKQTGAKLTRFDAIDLSGVNATATLAAIGKYFRGDAEADFVQTFEFDTDGIHHITVQPYDGSTIMPAEHHATLAGSLGATATFAASSAMFKGPEWLSHDPGLAEALTNDDVLRRACKKLVWRFAVPNAYSFDLRWTLQARPMGDNTSHVVMKVGSYGFWRSAAGFQQFFAVLDALRPHLSTSGESRQEFDYSCWADLFEQTTTVERDVAAQNPPA